MRLYRFALVLASSTSLLACANRDGAISPFLFNTYQFGPNTPITPNIPGIVGGTDTGLSITKEAIRELAAPDPDAPAYVYNGYNNIYRLCNVYFDNLILAQNKDAFSNDLAVSSGSTVGTILGLAKSSAAAIGIIAAGTGFASSVIQSYSNRALMTPYPSETKTLVITALDAYQQQTPSTSAQNKLQAISMVQHYAELCTYSGISRLAKQAISSATIKASSAPSADVTVLVQGIGARLGAQEATETDLETLYYYLVTKSSLWKSDPNAANSIIDKLPAGFQAHLRKDTTPIDPGTDAVIQGVKSDLITAYKFDSNFKTDVDAQVKLLSAPPAPAAPPPAATPPTNTSAAKAPAATAPKAPSAQPPAPKSPSAKPPAGTTTAAKPKKPTLKPPVAAAPAAPIPDAAPPPVAAPPAPNAGGTSVATPAAPPKSQTPPPSSIYNGPTKIQVNPGAGAATQ